MPGKRPEDPRIEEGASPDQAGPLLLPAGSATLTERASATAVDFIVLSAIGFGLTTALGVPWLGSSLLIVAVMLVVGGLYFVGSWTAPRGATPGMRIFGLSVRDATTGAPLTREAATRRWLVLGAPLALQFFYGWGVGLSLSVILAGYYGYLLFTTARSADGRGLHDEISGSVVVRTRP
jgi:uncharacterized RDD family membrane protein YckC